MLLPSESSNSATVNPIFYQFFWGKNRTTMVNGFLQFLITILCMFFVMIDILKVPDDVLPNEKQKMILFF
ncbi:UNVERIFIED_CONTAM: hypothetical protein POZ17_18640 [Ralstonia mannitolilytica]